MSNQRNQVRTPFKGRIKISHSSFGELLAQTINLSDTGVYVQHPALSDLPVGAEVTGQLQDLPFEAPMLRMAVVRVDAEGAGLRFI